MKRILLILTGAAAVAACATSAPMLSPAQAAEMGTIRGACAALGLNPNEAPFAYCVRSLTQSAPAAANARVAVSDTGGPYQAENACAAIGLDPSTARYSYCVGNLNQTLSDANNIGAR